MLAAADDMTELVFSLETLRLSGLLNTAADIAMVGKAFKDYLVLFEDPTISTNDEEYPISLDKKVKREGPYYLVFLYAPVSRNST